MSISYLEIYNELIKDLLNPGGPLELREDNRGQKITVAGLSEVTAINQYEVIQYVPNLFDCSLTILYLYNDARYATPNYSYVID